MMDWTCNIYRRDEKCIHNFDEALWNARTWKTEKMRG
jgi:hypothetical protein